MRSWFSKVKSGELWRLVIDRLWSLRYRPNLLAAMIIVCGSIAGVLVLRHFADAPFVAAIRMFAVALACFSGVALLKRESLLWRYVDYPWVLGTLVSLLIALTGNVSNINITALSASRHQFRSSISDVIRDIEAQIDMYCPDGSSTNESDTTGLYSCPRMKHFLYQAQSDFRKEALEEVTSRMLPQNWASEFCRQEIVPGHEQWNIHSESGPLCDPMHDFDKAKKAIDSALERYNTNTTFLDLALRSGTIQYWYCVYAILAALRLSRVTADILPRRRR